MEIELKYILEKKEDADRIFSDGFIRSITDENSEEENDYRAIYYDTEDRRFSRENMVLRLRQEGRRYVATLKWNGFSDSGFHQREEINVPVADAELMTHPTVEVFHQSQMIDELRKLLGDRKLIPVMEMEFRRRQMRLDTGKSICELSADIGRIICGEKTAPISELELELYSGSREDMEALGAKISSKFGLKPGEKSKFRQGLDLLD